MKILVIFPANNPFSAVKTKPVVLAGLSYIKYSEYQKNMYVLSPKTDTPILGYQVLTSQNKTKKQYYMWVLAQVESAQVESVSSLIIEVHQDVKLAGLIAKKFPKVKVVLVKHGQYLINRFRENIWIFKKLYELLYLKYINKVYCISNFVRDTLQTLYPTHADKFITAYNNYGHMLDFVGKYNIQNKKKQIVFTGKSMSHKGFVEFLEATLEFLKSNKEYSVLIISGTYSKGRKYAKGNKLMSSLDFKAMVANKRIKILNNITPEEVFANLVESEIAVVPTKSNEPFGLVALEYHLAACAVISSGNGGLIEISGEHAYYLPEVTKQAIIDGINYFAKDAEKTKKMALAGQVFVREKFNPYYLVSKIDIVREELISE